MKYFTFLSLVLIANAVIAQEKPSRDTVHLKSALEGVRYEFRGDTIPDYLAFFTVAHSVQDKAQNDPERAVKLIEKMFGVFGSPTVYELIDRTVQFLASYNADYDKATNATLCGSAKSDDELYRGLDDLEDTRHAIVERHYTRFVATLTEPQKKTLLSYLADDKQGQSYTAFDHRATYESSPHTVQQWVTTGLCERLGGVK